MKSKGHLLIGSLLAQTNFKIQEELPVSAIADTKYRGWYDWAILDLKVVIEIHGEQHYQATSFGKTSPGEDKVEQAVSNLALNKLRDSNKERIATEAGWGYLAVPYTELSGLTTEKLLAQINKVSSLSMKIEKKQKPIDIYKEKQKERAREYRKQQYQKWKEYK